MHTETTETTWHIRIEYTGHTTIDDIDTAAEHLRLLHPALTMHQDGSGGSVAVYIDATSATDAVELAIHATSDLLAGRTITGIEAQTEEAFLAALQQPTIPDVVGYAEIAEMIGVSRQRIRQLANYDTHFPQPIIETAQGPLIPKAAAEHWARTRNTKTGRPRKTATV
jgi:hypothetical protein